MTSSLEHPMQMELQQKESRHERLKLLQSICQQISSQFESRSVDNSGRTQEHSRYTGGEGLLLHYKIATQGFCQRKFHGRSSQKTIVKTIILHSLCLLNVAAQHYGS